MDWNDQLSRLYGITPGYGATYNDTAPLQIDDPRHSGGACVPSAEPEGEPEAESNSTTPEPEAESNSTTPEPEAEGEPEGEPTAEGEPESERTRQTART